MSQAERNGFTEMMNPFEFVKEIQQNRVQDEDYIKVSEMGGLPDDQYKLLKGKRIGGEISKYSVDF